MTLVSNWQPLAGYGIIQGGAGVRVTDNKVISISKCKIEFIPEEKTYRGKPMSMRGEANEIVGMLTTFRVTSTDLLDLMAGLVRWPSGDNEIKPIELFHGLEKHQQLERKGQIEIQTASDGNWLVPLRTLRFNPDLRYFTLVNAPVSDIDKFLGESFERLLLSAGAKKFGTRQVIDGETNRNANQLAMIIEPDNIEALAIAYTVTRPLAVIMDYGIQIQ